MKIIPNQETSILENTVKYSGSGKNLTYKDLIEVSLDIIPQGGFTPKDIRDRNRIQDALEVSSDEILLEDSDYESLKSIIKNSRWTIRHTDLGEFLDKFEKDGFSNAPKQLKPKANKSS